MASKSWRTPINLLVLMSIAMPVAHATWMVLINNFVVERAGFTGVEIGNLQSLREIPGFLAFTTVFVLLVLKEQSFACLALALLGVGTALTGFLPTEYGLYFTTVLMSLGFHYFETVKQSLSLQWFSKSEAPRNFGRLIAVGSMAAFVIHVVLWLVLQWLHIDYLPIYLVAGSLVVLLSIFMWFTFPNFPGKEQQVKTLVLRKRYWLYYALTLFSGARRQIFIVFASFLMVEKFGYTVANIALLYLVNYLFNWIFAERIGALIGKVGERRALTFEYVGLILVFTAYAYVENATLAAGLFVIDHMFFALAIAMSTYFQKIADPKDLASSAGVSFTINHIAAVIIPVLLGYVWIYSSSAVFLIGTGMALGSLLLARLVPEMPKAGNEVRVFSAS